MYKKAIIYDLSVSCGDGCCSWTEIYICGSDGDFIENFITVQNAITYCKERGWDYIIEYTE